MEAVLLEKAVPTEDPKTIASLASWGGVVLTRWPGPGGWAPLLGGYEQGLLRPS